ncbi:MAG: ribonuclease PH [Candidatus Omnitrophica bacterium]|nr:ribonuclease PH [Candidatus Omnitrophota bacterium]
MRLDKRKHDQLREVKIAKNYIEYAEGSCLIEVGNTKVICTASVEDKVPPFLKGSSSGWVTAEYGMLPRSCKTRNIRESRRGSIDGRTSEIQRLIGRSLRAIVDLKVLGERTIWIDCDVVQADGGTRTASITGGFVALYLAFQRLLKDGLIEKDPVKYFLAAVSVGIVEQETLLDLAYDEDYKADVDMNLVMTESGDIVEIQGAAEGEPFSKSKMDSLIKLAQKGIKELITIQKKILHR